MKIRKSASSPILASKLALICMLSLPWSFAEAAPFRDFARSGPTESERRLADGICDLADSLDYYRAFHELSLLGHVVPDWINGLMAEPGRIPLDPVLVGNSFFYLLAGAGDTTLISNPTPIGALASVAIGAASSSRQRDWIRTHVIRDYYYTDALQLDPIDRDEAYSFDFAPEHYSAEHLQIIVLQNHYEYDAFIERVDQSRSDYVYETAKAEIKDELRIDELTYVAPVCRLLKQKQTMGL